MPAERLRRRLAYVGALALVASVAAGCGSGGATRSGSGSTATATGRSGRSNEQSDAGADLAFIRHGAKPNGSRPSAGVSAITVAGKRVELVLGCDLYRSQHEQSRRGCAGWSSSRGVDILVTPQMFPTTRSIRCTRPGPARGDFISTGSTPLSPPGHNVFRIGPDDRQLSAGLGAYAFHTLGWRTAVTVGENDTHGLRQTAGFVAEFCSLGGTIVGRFWGSPRPPTGRDGPADPARVTEWR